MTLELETSRVRLLARVAFVRLGAQMQVAVIGELNLAREHPLAVLTFKSFFSKKINIVKIEMHPFNLLARR